MRNVLAFFVLCGALQAAELKITHTQSSSYQAVFDTSISPAVSSPFEFNAFESKTNKPLSLQAKTLPVHLLILVDTSSLCQLKKVDSYVNAMIAKLRDTSDAKTRLTLATFSNAGTKFLAKKTPLSSLESVQVECQGRALSTSYDQTLSKILEENRRSDLPTVAWIFSSGNIELSNSTLKNLRERDIELQILLYNEFVEKEIRPSFITTVGQIAPRTARLTVLKNLEDLNEFPSQRYQLTVSLPTSWQGSTSTLELQARSLGADKAVIAKTALSLSVPLNPWVSFWRRYGTAVMILAGLLFVAYLVRRLRKFYRPKVCSACSHIIAFKYATCVFCHKKEDGFLTGQFPLKSEGFYNGMSNSVRFLPLRESTVELGCHSKSPILFKKRGRLRCYAIIRRSEIQPGKWAYELVRSDNAYDVDIKINSKPLETKRFLATGDTLCVAGVNLNFVTGVEI